MPKELGTEPNRKSKKVMVIALPYCSPDPAGPMYEQYSSVANAAQDFLPRQGTLGRA